MNDQATTDDLPSWDGSDVADLLDLTPLGANRFRSRLGERNEHGRIYGGQLLGQAVMAASLTTPRDRPATYLQFLFAAGGKPEQAVDYEVSTVQNGKRFASRNVCGTQKEGRVLCDASISFASDIDAPAHAVRAASDSGVKTDPDHLPGLADLDAPGVRKIERTLGYGYRAHSAIDVVAPFAEDFVRGDPDYPRVRFWIRVRAPLRDDPVLHAAAFAYISDYWINFVASIAHVESIASEAATLYVASLNHAIWFHTPFRADQWLLFDTMSPRAARGRGLAIARVYSRPAELVASVTQECLMSPQKPTP